MWIAAPGFALGLALAAVPSDVAAVTPGVDIATPRVAVSNADGATLQFVPAIVSVEQGDYVQWKWLSGIHTTTSGTPCLANSLWNANLSSTTPLFTRQFLEAPGSQPYFCSPHCSLGMQGRVDVTTLINVTVTDVSGATRLDWTGGGGLYRIFRSDAALFPAGTVVLTPPGGTNQTSFVDMSGQAPAAGGAFFYLVMNQF